MSAYVACRVCIRCGGVYLCMRASRLVCACLHLVPAYLAQVYVYVIGTNALVAGGEGAHKRWLLYPWALRPGNEYPVYGTWCCSKDSFIATDYHNIGVDKETGLNIQGPSIKPLECNQHIGDIIYVPEGWHHSTIAVGEAVGTSVQLVKGAGEEEQLAFSANHLWKMGDMARKADEWQEDEKRWGALANALLATELCGWAENDVDRARAIVR